MISDCEKYVCKC